ncbi:MAG: HEAT repeat domain-containing protein [Phycisphaerales bacterium]|nr:HEAT repeat domain-containing protein [Phycisphaerales bacterium]
MSDYPPCAIAFAATCIIATSSMAFVARAVPECGSVAAIAMIATDDPKQPAPAEEPTDETAASQETPGTEELSVPEPPPATVPPAGIQPATADQTRQFDTVLHYILIAKPELVHSSIQVLFDSGITDEQLAQLVDERGLQERLDRALSRGRSMDGAAPLVAEFESRILAGTRATSRNAIRIEAAVRDLGGSMRQQMVARGRLLTAGEYAVPALVRALADQANPKLAAAARATLVDIKRLAVAPLCAGLEGSAASTQRAMCEILGEIGYPTAEPYLFALASQAGTPEDVRQAALRAYARLGGTSESASSQFAALARRYFDQTPALIPYPSDATNPVWEDSAAYGLVGTEIPTPVFCETMAVIAARRALELDPSSHAALSVFVAADLRRGVLAALMGHGEPSANAQEGEAEPVDAHPSILSTRYSAEFFATAAGARVAQTALGMAIDANDPLLARAVLAVLAKNGSAAGLVDPSGGRSPVVECLSFADRRVRCEASLLLAHALPQVGFATDSQVIPILASMVKSGGSIGAVIASTEEDRQGLASRVSALGIAAVVTGGTFSEAEGKVAPGQTIDLIIIQGARGAVDDAVRSLRVSRAAATAPVVVVTSGGDATGLSSDYESDSRVAIFVASAPEEAFARAVASAVGAAGGLAISEAEGVTYSTAALDALRLVAQTGSPVFDVRDAESTLVAALNQGESAQRLAVSGVLALIPTEDAQRALMDAALSASGDEQVALFGEVATSARKFGNLLLPRQVASLRGLIQGSTGTSADAAGAVHGALGLSTSDVVSLIIAPSK